MTDEELFEAISWRFILPYKICVDNADYKITHKSKELVVSIARHARSTPLPHHALPIHITEYQQVQYDSSGIAGCSEIRVLKRYEPPVDLNYCLEAVDSKELYDDAVDAMNRFIGLYRVKTGEFWLHDVYDNELFTYSCWIFPVGTIDGRLLKAHMPGNASHVAPFLKTNPWYDDFSNKLIDEWEVPLHLELYIQAKAFFESRNYRMSVTNCILTTEAVFRSLAIEYFPGLNMEEKPVKQMMGYYYNKYRDISSEGPYIRKKDAAKHLRNIWAARDKIMHGHSVDLDKATVLEVLESTQCIIDIWTHRPGAKQDLVVEGPFSGVKLSENPIDWIDRAKKCLKLGEVDLARHSIKYALLKDPDNIEAKKIDSFIDNINN